MRTSPLTRLFLITFSLIFSVIIAFGQSPVIQWQKTLGGSLDDDASCVQQTKDGGYIVAGHVISNDGDVTFNQGNGDVWIVKMDENRNIQWQKSFGGSGTESAHYINQTSDGSYIVAGTSNSLNGDVTGNHGGNDYWILKLDSAGIIQWQKSLGGSGLDVVYSCDLTSDGGCIVAGFSESNDGDLAGYLGNDGCWVVKIDAAGNIEWQNPLGGGYECAVRQTDDEGCIVTVFYLGHYWIVKLDISGSIEWQKFLGDIFELPRDIQQTNDGGYIVAGYAQGNVGNLGIFDFWIIKLDANGIMQWEKSYGGSQPEVPASIQQTADGGYVVAGYSQSVDGDVMGSHGGAPDFWVIRIDAIGNLLWQKVMGGFGADYARYIAKTADNGFVIAGVTHSNDGDVTGNHSLYSDSWVVKILDSICWIPATPVSITVHGGISKVCSGDTRTYTTGLTSDVTYLWTVPAGAVINSGQGTNSINVTYNNNFITSGIISVVKVNSCACSLPRNLTVNKNNPAIPSAISGLNFGLCGGRNIVYSVQSVAGVAFKWTVPGLANIVNGQGTNSITVNFQSVNFNKTISVAAINACGSSLVRTLVIRSAPQIPGAISGNTSVCSNSLSNIYSVRPVYSATNYTWIGPVGSHISANGVSSANNVLVTASNTVSIDFGNINTGSAVKVRANNDCGYGAYRNLLLSLCVPRLGDMSTTTSVAVYPNPANKLFNIVLNLSATTNFTITVNDMSGREIIREYTTINSGTSEHQIDLHKLNTGIYLLTILSPDGRQVIRFSKE
jgi:PKD-like domain/Secretion system C-terminal sorting domain